MKPSPFPRHIADWKMDNAACFFKIAGGPAYTSRPPGSFDGVFVVHIFVYLVFFEYTCMFRLVRVLEFQCLSTLPLLSGHSVFFRFLLAQRKYNTHWF